METVSLSQTRTKENVYFAICLLLSLAIYAGLGYFIGSLSQMNSSIVILLIYIVIIGLVIFLQLAFFIGHIRGNAIRLSEKQFPDIYQRVSFQANQLGLSKVPRTYILQAGGFLNAMATAFFGKKYVIIYSDLLEEAYEENMSSVEFVIGHELGHIKRNHLIKQFLIFPSWIIPFLPLAYSRACEYTCDQIGAALCPKGAKPGLLLLASGKKLYLKTQADAFAEQALTEESFWTWFSEKCARHPHLTKRLSVINKHEIDVLSKVTRPEPKVIVTNDHSKYMPL